MDHYPILTSPSEFQEELKKSRFITHLVHTPGIDFAKAFVHSIKKQYPDARHHCWAFVAGSPDDSMSLGFSDDGEPSGTAGKPILAQLLGSGIGEICAVVTRYSGGIKLGTGGLVKAYGGGVKKALGNVELEQKHKMDQLNLEFGYEWENTVRHILSLYAAEIQNVIYNETIMAKITVPCSNRTQLAAQLDSQLGGKLFIVPT